MLKLPMHLARVAMLGAAPLGGGFVSRAVSYAAGSQVRDAARQHLPSWAGGQTGTASKPRRPRAGPAAGCAHAATLAGAAASGGTLRRDGGGSRRCGERGSRPEGGRGPGTGARSERPRVRAAADRAGQRRGRALQNGLQTPSFAGREQDFANERFEAEFRERTSPVSAEQARAALASLPGGHPARDRAARLRSRRRRARASRLPGDGRMVAARSARRCARSPPPAPTCAPRPSATPATPRMATRTRPPPASDPTAGARAAAAASEQHAGRAVADPAHRQVRRRRAAGAGAGRARARRARPARTRPASRRARRSPPPPGARSSAAAARAARPQPRRTVPERIRRLDRAHRSRPSRIKAAVLGLHRRPDRRGVRRDHARLRLGEVRLAAARDAGAR